MTHDVGELIWVHYNPETATLVIEDQGFHTFGLFNSAEPRVEFLARRTTGLASDHDLLLLSYPQAGQPIPNYQVNRSIAALAKPLQVKTWRGPVVVIAVCQNPDGRFCLVDDPTWRDIAATVKYFRGRPDNIGCPLLQEWRDIDPALQMTDVENRFISSAFAVGEAHRMAPIHVPARDRRQWLCCMPAHRLGLNWFLRSGNCRSWKGMDYTENKDAGWLK